jgi:chromosome partitioning protein
MVPTLPDGYRQVMRSVLVFSGKGGAGKTTVARELAVAASLAGRQVAMVDLDPQAGLTGWFARREADAPGMVTLPSSYSLAAIRAAGVDELVIDLPPGVPSAPRH